MTRPILLALLACAAMACGGEASDAADDTQAAATAGDGEAIVTPAEEERILRGILKAAVEKYEAKYGEKLGWGWTGNVTGYGDKCDVVLGNMSEIIDKLVRDDLRTRKTPFVHHDIGTLVAAGWLCESLSGHVYMGLYRLTKGKAPRAVGYFDPWRDRDRLFETDPNTSPGEPELWGIPKYRVF